MYTFYSFTFGCRVNEAEKVVLDKKLLSIGYTWTDQDPDIYIINSCAVTGKAEREVRQHIYQTRKKYPFTKMFVTGCAATNWIKHNISITEVDYLIENDKKHSLPEIIQSILGSPPCHSLQDKKQHEINTHDKFIASGRMMIKIQDGCDRYCSYCIVPYLRGKPKSFRISDIINTIKKCSSNAVRNLAVSDEVRSLHPLHSSRQLGSNNTISEVILTAINTECFGKDTGETLIQLIDTILKQTTIPKISFGSIHPWSITDNFLAYYQSIMSSGRFEPFFHIPIQSGSDQILTYMNRGYTTKDIELIFTKIKKINKDAYIGTDIIVGFPGETNKEFQETYTFLKRMPINKIHVFRYSPRPGTAAEKLSKLYEVPASKETLERSLKLRELIK